MSEAEVADGTAQPMIDLEAFGASPRIVVVVRDHMSGVLYSTPALRSLRRRWPESTITLVTSSYSMPILDGGCPYIDRVLPLFSFSDEPKRSDRARDLLRKFQTWARLVGRVDLVVHLRDVGSASLLFAAALGKPVQVGYSQGGRFADLLTHDLGWADVELGSRQRNQIILEAMGIEPDGHHVELWLDDADRRWARDFLTRNGHTGGEHLTVVHPGSHWGCNQWLPERWSETIDGLLAEHGGTVVLTGVAREHPLGERIASGVAKGDRVINACGETSLGHYAAIIEAADLVMAVDAAATQICQAFDKPSVIMMGAGNPAWNGPMDGEPMLMLQEWDNDNPRPEVCRWSDGACNGPQCSSRLEDISVTNVLASVEELSTKRFDGSTRPS